MTPKRTQHMSDISASLVRANVIFRRPILFSGACKLNQDPSPSVSQSQKTLCFFWLCSVSLWFRGQSNSSQTSQIKFDITNLRCFINRISTNIATEVMLTCLRQVLGTTESRPDHNSPFCCRKQSENFRQKFWFYAHRCVILDHMKSKIYCLCQMKL